MSMVTVIYKREHIDDYNNIHDILLLSLFMYVDSIDDRQHIRILRTVPSKSSVLLFIPPFHSKWDYKCYVDLINFVIDNW